MRVLDVPIISSAAAVGAAFMLLLSCGIACADEEIEALLQESQVAAVPPEQVIIEKNLFSPDRKRWDMPAKGEQKAAVSPAARQDINNITLYGTIIIGEKRQAILRAQPGAAAGARRASPGPSAAQQDNRPYQVGDYIAGFRLVDIQPRKVILRDESAGENFDVFISEEKADRTAVKTEIREEPRVAAAAASTSVAREAPAAGKSVGQAMPAPRRAETATMLRQRAQRSLNVMKTRDSDLVRRQAQRDIDRLEQLLPTLSEDDKKDFARLKSEFEALQKK